MSAFGSELGERWSRGMAPFSCRSMRNPARSSLASIRGAWSATSITLRHRRATPREAIEGEAGGTPEGHASQIGLDTHSDRLLIAALNGLPGSRLPHRHDGAGPTARWSRQSTQRGNQRVRGCTLGRTYASPVAAVKHEWHLMARVSAVWPVRLDRTGRRRPGLLSTRVR
jgi:hypothetical protein